MKATIKDVARLSNVSATTVSLILNGKEIRASEETRARVLQAAKQLGYEPNPIAVALITKKSRTVGLVLPNIGNFFFSELSKLVERELDQQQYALLFGNSMGTAEKGLDYLKLFINKGVDGIIFVRASKSSENYAERFDEIVKSTQVPIVMADRIIENNSASSVTVNQELGGYLATRHLLELGHRRIGCITAEPTLENVISRLDGYRCALAEFGIEFDPELVCSGNFNIATGKTLTPSLLEKGVTAIFAFNDPIAIGAYRACSRRGLRIPEDISIVGYDDIVLSEIPDRPLTTVHQPVELIAKEAVDLLLSLIDAKEKYKKDIILQPKLIVRESTCPPKRK